VLDLVQAQVDIAIRYASLGGASPLGKPLVDYSTFPVCTPALMRDPARPLRTFADLAQHVLLEFETTVHGRPWYDWEQWFSAVKTAKFKPAGRQRFSHYDQVVEAALAGSGVAIGKRPHLNGKLQAGTLCAPFGTDGVATLGSFHVVVAPSATGRGAVGEAFVAWLRSEVRRDERALAKKRD
jgi:LysR family glycine cleavage system transcriptional activator